RVRNRVLESAAVEEQLLELEAISLALPEITVRWNSLGHPRARCLCFVNKGRADHPRVRELDRSSRTHAQAGNRRHLSGDERAERIYQNVLVVNITTVKRVLRVDAIVDADQVFAIVERVWLLERDVVADWAVCICSSEANGGAINVRNSAAISR